MLVFYISADMLRLYVQVTREDEDGDGQARHVHITCLYRGGGARGENDSGRVSFNICKSRTTRYFSAGVNRT